METDICYIYELIDPRDNQTRYIGRAVDIKKRYKGHLEDKNISHKRNWVKHLENKGYKPIINPIDVVPLKEQEFWELYYISLYKSWGVRLTNMRFYGNGGWMHNEESRKKISEGVQSAYDEGRLISWTKGKAGMGLVIGWPKGKKKAQWIRDNISKGHIGQKAWNEGKKLHYDVWNKGVKNCFNDETIKRMSEANKGQIAWNKDIPMKEISKQRVSDTKLKQRKEQGLEVYIDKPIYQFDLEGNFIKEYKNYKKAGKYFGGNILGSCKEEVKTSNNFIWVFAKDYSKEYISKRVEWHKDNRVFNNKWNLGRPAWNRGMKNPMSEESMAQKVKNSSNVSEVYQLDINTGEVINKFRSAEKAGEFLGNKNFACVISRVCRGVRSRKDYRGFKWIYAKDYKLNATK